MFYTRIDADGVHAISLRDDADWTEFPTESLGTGEPFKGMKWLNRNVIRGEFKTYYRYTEVCLTRADSQRWHKVCIEIIAEHLQLDKGGETFNRVSAISFYFLRLIVLAICRSLLRFVYYYFL